ncbi:hypothetical protein JTB14_005036 [Gonioctena quinquepunctata]|nr:hypothetical protein JTB14_005036 [Gonioctena quinquepunctata]
MSERTFRVRVGNTFSSLKYLENGVPQGSTLSVTLFAIAVNDIASAVDPTVGICLYVDDLAIIASAPTVGTATRKLQQSINQIVQNTQSVGYKFSREKTSCVHFCRLRRPHYDPRLTLGDTVIECKESIKFLGLIFDSKLTWQTYR